jgi:hypothetical protein
VTSEAMLVDAPRLIYMHGINWVVSAIMHKIGMEHKDAQFWGKDCIVSDQVIEAYVVARLANRLGITNRK